MLRITHCLGKIVYSVYQCLSKCGPRTTGGRQAVSGEKQCKNCIRLLTNEKHIYTCPCLWFDLQQKVGELDLSINSFTSVIISQNNLN
jgi:hypothetical protein